MSFHNVGDGVLGNSEIVGDPSVGATFADSLTDFWGELVGFCALTRLSAELLASRPGCGKAGFDTFA